MARRKYAQTETPMFDVPRAPRVRSGVSRPSPRVRGVGSAKRMGVPTPQSTGISSGEDWADGPIARSEAQGTLSPYLSEALRRARAGDDSMLLPYQPTPSINPPRPRTLAAGYDRDTKTMFVRFRDGVGYEYYNVSPQTWNNFKRVKSPGRAINRYFPRGSTNYARADW